MQTPIVANVEPEELVLIESGESVGEIINPAGKSEMLLVCEHASHHIPKYFNGLGLNEQNRHSHAAWDPGAKDLAIALSRAFDAPLVCSKISRLVYDCNRPMGAPSAMPSRSEVVDVPGNVDISFAEAEARFEQVYLPFEKMVSEQITIHHHPILVTVHSFTPIFHGEKRGVEIGLLHDEDARLADAMLEFRHEFPHFVIERNQPYGPADGVAHTIDVHGRDKGLLNVMIEVRNDLLTDENSVLQAAEALTGMINLAMEKLNISIVGGR